MCNIMVKLLRIIYCEEKLKFKIKSTTITVTQIQMIDQLYSLPNIIKQQLHENLTETILHTAYSYTVYLYRVPAHKRY